MMEAAIPLSWREQFRLAAEERKEDIRWRERMAKVETRQHELRAGQLAKEKREAEDRAITRTFASRERIDAFTHKLDRYDTATVDALMENRVALDKVRDQLDAMLKDAHVLPDGRRVFKTRDGTQVFDEHGTELKPEAIDPHLIDETRPRWEDFRSTRDVRLLLERERHEMIEFQRRVDGGREKVGGSEVTTNDLDKLGAGLESAMPDAVRRKIVGDYPDHSVGADRDLSRTVIPSVERVDPAPPRIGMPSLAP